MEAHQHSLLERDPLKRLCLSFALYKLLRRRLEDFPITNVEARNCHALIFKGLCEEDMKEEDSNKQGRQIHRRGEGEIDGETMGKEEGNHGEESSSFPGSTTDTMREETKSRTLFQVLDDEVQFLCEYYHSIHPVVFASPFFFLMNYVMCPIVTWALCILVMILCSNGDVINAFHSLRTDNYPITVGILKMTGCLQSRVTKSPADLFSTVDISVTILLVLTFVYEEVWEFIVFLLSNWFMVSLICGYASKPQ